MNTVHKKINGVWMDVPFEPKKEDFGDRDFYRKKVTAEVSKLQEVRYEPLGDGYTPIMKDATVGEVVENILDMFL